MDVYEGVAAFERLVALVGREGQDLSEGVLEGVSEDLICARMRSFRRCSLHLIFFDVWIASALCVPGFVDGFGDDDDSVEGFVEVERDGHSSGDMRDIVLSSSTLEMRDCASMMKKKLCG